MAGKYKISILGNGRIARAVLYYLRKDKKIAASLLEKDSQAARSDLLIGALPGELGKKGLELALKHKKDLLDISDIDPPYYLKNKSKIRARGITVVPGCGFSPGVVNLILGRELSKVKKAREVVVKAGSLSYKKNYFPFLWCFEDLVLEHRIPSWQAVGGKKKKFPAFAGYEKEKFFGIDAESYYCASGFENLLSKFDVKDFKTKVIRPKGFREFFLFLQNEGFLEKDTYMGTKNTVERNIGDNMTLAQIIIDSARGKRTWLLKTFSRKNEALNSMQKLTASVPAAMAGFLARGIIKERGLLFMEELGRDNVLGGALFANIRKQGVIVKHD